MMLKKRLLNFQKSIGTIKDSTIFHQITKVFEINQNISCFSYHMITDNRQKSNLRFIKIQFDAPIFDKIVKDRAAKFVDMLSAIGGTMGLLTGFSIISGIEIIYFAVNFCLGYVKKLKA